MEGVEEEERGREERGSREEGRERWKEEEVTEGRMKGGKGEVMQKEEGSGEEMGHCTCTYSLALLQIINRELHISPCKA